MSHTPGPWRMFQHPDPDCPCISIGQEDDTFSGGFVSVYLNIADNARLIAAAPDLLEALEPFANYACDPPCGCHNCRAKIAIAKAKGEVTQ